jgi:hypothetical protein
MSATIEHVRRLVEQTVQDHRSAGMQTGRAIEAAAEALGISPRRVRMYRDAELSDPPRGKWFDAWLIEVARIKAGVQRHNDAKARRLERDLAALKASRGEA